MSVRHFTDLIVWRLCDELRREVVAFTATPPASRDGKFCNQIRGSADDSCSLTAEGFGRFLPADFRNFLRMAKGSLDETQDRLKSALEKSYLSQDDFERIWLVSERAIKANLSLQRYLRQSGRFGPRRVSKQSEERGPEPEREPEREPEPEPEREPEP
jgi:four helix bundle protein